MEILEVISVLFLHVKHEQNNLKVSVIKLSFKSLTSSLFNSQMEKPENIKMLCGTRNVKASKIG